MEIEEAFSLEELARRCSCCFKELNIAPFVEISSEIERIFGELVQYEFISRDFSSSICIDCDNKLSEFNVFKTQLQENQKNLEKSLQIAAKSTESQQNECKAETDEENYIEEYLDPEYEEQIEAITEEPTRQICPICAKYFSSSSIDIHIKRMHTDNYDFYCDQCPQKFKVKRDLSSHLLKHTEVEQRKRFQCEFCENSYTKKSSLRHHLKMRHEEVKEAFFCECGASFKTKLRLNYHKKMIHEKGEYRCNECNRTYPSIHNLKIHISHFHSAKTPCIYCGKLVAPGSFMKRHLKIHEPASHTCEVCSKAFTVRETLLEHQRTVHQMGEAHFCENCGKSFGSKKVLKRHIERSHTVVEKVKCLIHGCSYAAVRKDNLINHVKIHKDVDENHKADVIAQIKALKNLSW